MGLRSRILASVAALLIAEPAFAQTKTPPQLTASTSIASNDLLLVWPTAAGGPLHNVQYSVLASQLQSYLGSAYLQGANNLSDLTNVGVARANLGLGASAVANIGVAAGTVAAGNDSRFASACQITGCAFTGGISGTTGNFSGNFTDNGILTAAGSLIAQGVSLPNATAFEVTNACAGVGSNYGGCWLMNNASGASTNPNKTFRLNSTGGLEIVNSAYNAVIFTLTDAGGLALAGGISTSTGSFTSTVTAPTFSGNLSGNATTATSATSAGSASTATFAGTASVANSVAAGSVGSAGLASGAAVGNIGYTPVNKAGDTMTGNLNVPTVIGALSGNATTATTAATANTCATGCTTQSLPVAFVGPSASGGGSISYGTAAPGTLATNQIYLQTN